LLNRRSASFALLMAAPLLAGIGRGAPALARERVALVIGDDEGLATDPPLRYAESDAVEMSRVLVEMGTVRKGAAYRLLGADAAAAARAFASVVRLAGPGGEVLLFFSGHGDGQGAHLAGTTWAWSDIRRMLGDAPATLVIAFFDACASGALITAKGIVRGPPLSVSVAALGSSGRFLITSSGANEASYESVTLGGSPFALHLRSGIRGAADENHDGRVTLSELYGYLYSRTVASTLAAPLGPQRPAQLSELRGTGETVLATLGGLARVVRGPSAGEPCYALDSSESRVLAELDAAGGSEMALPAGQYIIKCVQDNEVRTARMSLVLGSTPLESGRFSLTPRLYALAKGPRVPLEQRLTVAGGALLGGGERGSAAGLAAIRYRLGFGEFRLHAQVAGLSSPRTLLPALGVSARLPWPEARGLSSDVGLIAAIRVGEAGERTAAGVGPFLEATRALGPRAGIVARIEFVSFYPVASGGAATGSFLFSLGVAFGLGINADDSPNGRPRELTITP
jgi:Caspase domain